MNAYVSLCIFTSAMLYNGGVCCRKVSIHPSAIMSCSVTQSVTQAYCFLSSQKKYAVEQFLSGLNSGTTARSTGDLAESVYVQRVVRKRFPVHRCVPRKRRNVWSTILLMSRIPGLRAGYRKTQLPTVDSLLVGTTRRLVPTGRSDSRLGSSSCRTASRFLVDASFNHNMKHLDSRVIDQTKTL